MHICMVISVPMPPREGIGYYTWNLSRFLKYDGHRVQIITRGQAERPPYEELGGIPIWRPRFYPVYPFHVHLHGLFLQRLVRQLEVDVDLYHVHTPLPPPLRTNKPQLVTVHGAMREEARSFRVKSLRTLLAQAQMPVSFRIEHKLFDGAPMIAVVARSVAEELAEYGLDPNQVRVLANGVDIGMFHPAEGEQVSRLSNTYVFAAGRLDLRKGFEDLVEAMPNVVRQIPDVCLCVAGDGPLRGEVIARAERLGLGHAVRFLGHVERDEMLSYYQGATVFAHAAHYEGLPTVLLEAMACGRAVVSTAVSGALDVVEDGVNGLLVPPHAPDKLAAAICRLLEDARLRARLGAAARRTVEERYSWQAVGAAYLRCYRALLRELP